MAATHFAQLSNPDTPLVLEEFEGSGMAFLIWDLRSLTCPAFWKCLGPLVNREEAHLSLCVLWLLSLDCKRRPILPSQSLRQQLLIPPMAI